MDSFEWNKIAGAVLGTVLFVMVVRIGVESVFSVPPLAKQAYVVQGVQQAASPSGGVAAPAEEPLPDFATAVPMASAANGMMIAERCAVCHDWTKGGPNKIGPNLYGIVGRARATAPGFDYSPAMKGKGGSWSYADLFQYLKQPALFVPGNKMAFAGLPKAQDRLDVIAFLRMQADAPAPLPPPGAAPAAGAKAVAPAPAPAPAPANKP